MRWGLFLLMCALAAPAAAKAPDAAFAERSVVLAVDRRCDVLDERLRAALAASATQARGALLRAGWSEARVDTLSSQVRAAAARWPCDDPKVAQAVADARLGFDGWAKIPSMRFPGTERAWSARRTPDPEGFLVRQDAQGAAFGLRPEGLALALPLSGAEAAPASARLVFRDVVRSPRSMADLPGASSAPLAQRAPSRTMSAYAIATSRKIESKKDARRALFAFPADAAGKLALLDPREAVLVELDGRKPVLIEVGDFAAARMFLAARS
jgi:hypothetical protein